MKTIVRFWKSAGWMILMLSQPLLAQKVDEQRMQRDMAVAENVLSTLIKQQFDQQRMFFPLEVTANYQPGYGVTFYLPADFTTPINFAIGGDGFGSNNFMIWSGPEPTEPADAPEPPEPSVYINSSADRDQYDQAREERGRQQSANTIKLAGKTKKGKKVDMDSVRDAYNLKVIEAAKMFLVDYGDMITQLQPDEKIIVANQGDQPHVWVGQYFNTPQRTHLSVEVTKSDLTAYKQGKLNHDQVMAKVKVVNTESMEAVEPDFELLSSIFNRLYRADLSKTYFMEDNIYYERLKDYGVVYYLQMYSGVEIDYQRYAMPTLGLEDIDLATRNKKVAELYPTFEKEMKENILDYGRTLKSLKDNEQLIFQIKLTRCAGCGIPTTLECSVKGNVLKEFNAGKLDKNAALGKITVKKGANQ
jgi:hypothetical protein